MWPDDDILAAQPAMDLANFIYLDLWCAAQCCVHASIT